MKLKSFKLQDYRGELRGELCKGITFQELAIAKKELI